MITMNRVIPIIGGIVLHQGRIAEMKTGEGKTLAATLAVCLNALAGRGVHVAHVGDAAGPLEMERAADVLKCTRCGSRRRWIAGRSCRRFTASVRRRSPATRCIAGSAV